jgi:hypothetical protein
VSDVDIEGTLSAHEYAITHLTGGICVCGFVPTVNPETLATQQDYHHAHVAAVLREQIREWLADFSWTETARDDLLSALAAHLSDTERAESCLCRDPLREGALAEAWDEGHRSFCAMPEHYSADHVHPHLNPYRAAHLSDTERAES